MHCFSNLVFVQFLLGQFKYLRKKGAVRQAGRHLLFRSLAELRQGTNRANETWYTDSFGSARPLGAVEHSVNVVSLAIDVPS